MSVTESTSSSQADEWLNYLQNSGYRLTAPLRVLVGILSTSQHALGPVELYDLGRRQHPKLGLVTVYRTLDKLEELGLVQRVHQGNGCHMYLRAIQGHQHLLLCTCCGKAEYFSGDELNELIAATARKSGFNIQGHWLQFDGLCAACQVREGS